MWGWGGSQWVGLDPKPDMSDSFLSQSTWDAHACEHACTSTSHATQGFPPPTNLPAARTCCAHASLGLCQAVFQRRHPLRLLQRCPSPSSPLKGAFNPDPSLIKPLPKGAGLGSTTHASRTRYQPCATSHMQIHACLTHAGSCAPLHTCTPLAAACSLSKVSSARACPRQHLPFLLSLRLGRGGGGSPRAGPQQPAASSALEVPRHPVHRWAGRGLCSLEQGWSRGGEALPWPIAMKGRRRQPGLRVASRCQGWGRDLMFPGPEAPDKRCLQAPTRSAQA